MLANHSATFKGFTIMTCINACTPSGSWVPRSRGGKGATTITPQGRRTPTGIPTGYLATSLPAPRPHNSPHHTEARDSVEVTGNPRGKPLTMTGEGEGENKKRQTLRYWDIATCNGTSPPSSKHNARILQMLNGHATLLHNK